MTYPTFPMAVDSSRLTRTPVLRKAQFGDGYVQAAPAGLNHNLRQYAITIQPKKGADIDAVDAFLAERGGYLPFWWTPPGEVAPRLFVCETWEVDETHLSAAKSLTATFQERPA